MRNLLALVILYLPISSVAQAPDYPKNYFRNPLNIPILLAGNFGECRPGHFHSGIDIKTQAKENLPVFAAADGYISRIKMEPGGFGHALYVTHPNGYTTLYAHLNDFKPEVQKYVRQKQYASESWTQDLSLTPDQFPVKKGEQIAWSGNTGGSTAPHLHFEIRDTKTEHPLNPQLFGFEVPDKVAPKIQKLALYNLNGGIYALTPSLFPVKSTATGYVIAGSDTLEFGGSEVGLGLIVDDYMDGSTNTLAFYTAEWYVDEVLQGRIRLDDIGYEETRYLNAYADYRSKQMGQPWIQCLFRLPGNGLGKVYEDLNPDKGMLIREKGGIHNVRIELRDVAGNSSTLRFTLRSQHSLPPPPCDRWFEPGQVNRLDTLGIVLETDKRAFYDHFCMTITRMPDIQSLSDRFQAGDATIPVHTPIQLRLKSRNAIPFALRSKVVLVVSDGKKEKGTAAKTTGQGSYEAKVRSLGEYRLVADTTAPKIEMVRTGGTSLRFRVKEDLTSVKSFRGEIDGKWVLFEQHEDLWTYVFDNHCPAGPHLLRLKAVDESGNESVKEIRFVR